MATLTVQEVVIGGLTPSYAACGNSGDTFANDGKTFALINNTSVVYTYTATFVTAGTFGGRAIADKEITLDPSESQMVGPFNRSAFNNGAGRITVTYHRDDGTVSSSLSSNSSSSKSVSSSSSSSVTNSLSSISISVSSSSSSSSSASSNSSSSSSGGIADDLTIGAFRFTADLT